MDQLINLSTIWHVVCLLLKSFQTSRQTSPQQTLISTFPMIQIPDNSILGNSYPKTINLNFEAAFDFLSDSRLSIVDQYESINLLEMQLS